MKLNHQFRRHNTTKYIQIKTHFCEACWTCLDACPNHVLGKIDIGFHKHARIVQAENCKGCKKCVLACSHNAIEYIYKPKHQMEVQDQLCETSSLE